MSEIQVKALNERIEALSHYLMDVRRDAERDLAETRRIWQERMIDAQRDHDEKCAEYEKEIADLKKTIDELNDLMGTV